MTFEEKLDLFNTSETLLGIACICGILFTIWTIKFTDKYDDHDEL